MLNPPDGEGDGEVATVANVVGLVFGVTDSVADADSAKTHFNNTIAGRKET